MGIALRPRMIRVDRHVSAPAEAAWQLLTDVRAWPQWGPSVRRAALDDGGTELTAGARGTVWTVAGVRMGFTITEFEPGRRWSWRVAGVPATGHEVIDAPQGCRVAFEVPWWAGAYTAVCSVALGRIDALLAAGQPPQ
ncbi:MAG: SRPBCC family protein [Mycobacterium sp.]|nr:SRPBCC family protein [Mycobacterium sp.]MCX6480497.1 SRPBCC family protein [Mycobacterium sp.]